MSGILQNMDIYQGISSRTSQRYCDNKSALLVHGLAMCYLRLDSILHHSIFLKRKLIKVERLFYELLIQKP